MTIIVFLTFCCSILPITQNTCLKIGPLYNAYICLQALSHKIIFFNSLHGPPDDSVEKNIKLDEINKKIIAITHTRADISNQELSERVGLSNSACFQRTKALKEAGYLITFHSDLDIRSDR